MKASVDLDGRCEACGKGFSIPAGTEYSYPMTCDKCVPKKEEKKLEKKPAKKATKKKPKLEDKDGK